MADTGSVTGRRSDWGAEPVPGGTSFRLWAPTAPRVTVEADGVRRPMQATGGGWFEAFLPVAAGARYRFQLDDGPIDDPAARALPDGPGGAALVDDPAAFRWQTPNWRGRPWAETVISELHVGTFTDGGTFRAAIGRLPALAEAGITAIELMPVASFAGARGWGYDGVQLYAPHAAYGTPDDLRALVDAAHGLGLMVFLDVVYNHFGPVGNPLPRLAPAFFHPERHTPWGTAIAYERPEVRRFFIDNALMWLRDYRFDGLRFDAVDHIRDDGSEEEILIAIAREVRAAFPGHHVHLMTEDNRNITRLHARGPDGSAGLHTAEWNDDLHNVAHVIATGETEGYYTDFAEHRWEKYARALAEGFAFQGEPSRHAGGAARGEPSGHMPPLAFVDFLQNHDQIGNRAFGERLTTLAPAPLYRALLAILLLSPHVPLLFMGDEWGERRPFVFFTDFTGDLADAVREGRRREFAAFAAFKGEHARAHIPDPNDPASFAASRLDWAAREAADGQAWLRFIRGLLAIRARELVPHLEGAREGGRVIEAADGRIAVDWPLDGAILRLRARLVPEGDDPAPPPGRVIWQGGAEIAPLAVTVTLETA
nr:malto-oligosyltrehalose trehalohydrolase [Amaricoccus macauensis]